MVHRVLIRVIEEIELLYKQTPFRDPFAGVTRF